MSMRFLRRIRIAPGVRLNVGKKGVSLSLGPRGASVTAGPRGVWGNVGLPGTGLSFRRKLDTRASSEPPGASPDPVYTRIVERTLEGEREPSEHELNEAYVTSLQRLLRGRERGDIDWEARLDVGPAPDDDEGDEFEQFARRVAAARFARRMVDGDPAAWVEVLAEELGNEGLPFDFAFDFGVDDETGAVSISIELPPIDVVPSRASRALKNGGTRYRQLPVGIVRELYEDVCCALVLRFIHEVYRTIADADHVSAQGYRRQSDPATGAPVRAIFLACVTDRESFRQLDLDQVDPSSAFAHLGGAAKLSRGMLVPIGFHGDVADEL